MNRTEFHKLFKTPGPVVLPVIHVLDSDRTRKNVEILLEAGAQGCFLINYDFEPDKFLPIIRDTRAAFPALWVAMNFLAVTGQHAFPMLGQLQAEDCQVDAYWADDACIDEDGANVEASRIAAARDASGWDGLYFGGTAFKKQREVDPSRYADAARALSWMLSPHAASLRDKRLILAKSKPSAPPSATALWLWHPVSHPKTRALTQMWTASWSQLASTRPAISMTSIRAAWPI